MQKLHIKPRHCGRATRPNSIYWRVIYVAEFLGRDLSAAVLVERPECRPQTLLLVVAFHSLSKQVAELAELDLTALCTSTNGSCLLNHPN